MGLVSDKANRRKPLDFDLLAGIVHDFSDIVSATIVVLGVKASVPVVAVAIRLVQTVVAAHEGLDVQIRESQAEEEAENENGSHDVSRCFGWSVCCG